MTAYTEKCSRSMTVYPDGLREILRQAFCQWMQSQRLRFKLAQERRQLLEMPEHQLKDIGLCRADAIDEALRSDIPPARAG